MVFIEKIKKWCVYEHVFPNGKRYIGITSKRPKARWDKGRGYKSRNSPVYRAVLKYGWDNIEHNILFKDLTQEQAFEKEKELIAEYKTNITRYGPDYGYNLTDGGEGALGHQVPEELKQKTRNRLLGKTGKECPNSRPVVCDGVEYESLTDFKVKNGNPKGNIRAWLRGEVGMPKFWYDKKLHYKHLGFEIVRQSEVTENRNRKVAVGDIVFSNLEECGKYLGVAASSISLYLNNKEAPPKRIVDSNLRYEDEEFHIFKENNPKSPGRKLKYECEGIIFESQKKLAEYLGVKPATLNSWLKGKNQMPKYIVNKNIKSIE